MKRIIVILLSVLISCTMIAQVQTYVQKGIVRSQSFANKNGTRIVGAVIMRSGDNVDPVISLNTPEEGYFELLLDNSGVYYISSVKAPKGTQYKLLYPLPNDRLEYTHNVPLTIVMQSNKDLDEYATRVKDSAIKEAVARFEKEKKLLEEKCIAGQLSILEKERKIEDLQKKLDDFDGLILDHIYETLKNTDFEALDSLHKEISIALESGDYVRADSLLNWRTESDRRAEFIRAKKQYEHSQYLADVDRNTFEKVASNTLIEKNGLVISALGQLDFAKALTEMEERLFYDSTNVNYLSQIGELLEIRFNDYHQALNYYQKALFYAAEADNILIASCHNHLGSVYNSLSEFATADEHYSQARQLLESMGDKAAKDLYDSYLGLGNVNQMNFAEALSYYNKCVNTHAKTINSKAYWQARLGIGQVKLMKGDYHGARSDFHAILKEIESMQNVDIATMSMAYYSMIECMYTIGQYQEAINICNAAKIIIEKHSSPKNTYIANILTQQGSAFISLGKIKEGEKCMNEAIDIYKNILGKSHPNYANACRLFADYYNLMGELEKSEEMCNEALWLYSAKFGKNHLTTVPVRFSKCLLYQTYADFEKAQAELDTIRVIYKSSGLLTDYNRITINVKEAEMKIAQGEPFIGIKLFQEAINCVIVTLGKDAVQLIEIYNKMAMAYLEQLEIEKARIYFEKAQSLADKIYGSENPIAIMQQIGMGQYYVNKGEYRKAYGLYSMVAKVVEETYGTDNHMLCNVYSMLGDYHLNQYQFDKAKYYYDKQYEIVKSTYGENHFFVAEPITKIGAYYMHIGNIYKGLEKEQQAYDILSAHFGIGHKATLISRLGICSAYINLGQFDKADSILSELSKSVEKELGKNHWTYPSILQIKATLYQNKGEFNNAIEYIEEAITITEAIYGQHHSNTLQLYEQLSLLYSNICSFPKAIEYNDIAISIATNYYGKDNVGVMSSLLKKGQLYASLNQIAEAHKIYDKVKNVYIDNFGGYSCQLTSVLISESQLLLEEGYGEDAIEILTSLETQMISIYGENSTQMCAVYNALADAFQSIMQYKKARDYYQKSLDIVKCSFGATNVNCIHPLVGLGVVCMSEDVTGQQLGKAYHYFSIAGYISASVYGANNANTATIDGFIGKIFLRQGKLHDAYNKFQKYNKSIRQTLGDNLTIDKRIANGYMNMGYYYLAKANAASFQLDSVNIHNYATLAMEQFEKSKTIAEAIYGAEYIGLGSILDAIAQTHFVLKHPDSAIATYITAAELALKQYGKHSPLVAQAYATLGNAYKYESDQISGGNEGQLNTAKEYFIKAISIRENSQGSSVEVLMASTMDWRMSLSAIYMKLGDYDNAFKTIDKIITELEGLQIDNKSYLYNCYYKKAEMLAVSGGNVDEALESLLKAKGIFSTLCFPNSFVKAVAQFQLTFALGNVYEIKGIKDDAILNYEKAYDLLRYSPNDYQTVTLRQMIRNKIKMLSGE